MWIVDKDNEIIVAPQKKTKKKRKVIYHSEDVINFIQLLWPRVIS